MNKIMTFIGATITAFLRWRNYSDRASRSEYWYYALFCGLVNILLMFIMFLLLSSSLHTLFYICYLVFLGFLYVPGLSLSVRRLHDINLSGWMLIFAFVPVIGGFALLIAFLYPGTKGANKYGPDPAHA